MKEDKIKKEKATTENNFENGAKGKVKRWLINTSATIILIAIIVSIYIGAHIAMGKVVLPEYDCIPEKLYSITPETIDKIGNNEKDVTITLINYGNSTQFINFIERYTEINDHIKVERIDNLESRADIRQEYGLEETQNLVVVKSGDNEKTLSNDNFYTYDYTTYDQIDTTEEAITNAIMEVTADSKPKIYFLSTHIKYDVQYYSTILGAIASEANEVENLDILVTGKVPDDCSCLIMTTLKEDITEQEKEKILDYIVNGGEILLLNGPEIIEGDTPNFQEILDQYGLKMPKGVVVEGDSNNMVSANPYYIVEKAGSNSLTKNTTYAANVCFVGAGKIMFEDAERLQALSVTTETLFTTTDKAFLRTNLDQNSTKRTEEDGEEETITIGAIATKTMGDENISKLVVFSNEVFAMDMPVRLNGYVINTVELYNNKDFILNSIAYLTDKQNGITIRKKYETVNYTVTEEQNRIIKYTIFIIPIIIIAVGIIVWILRRKK